MLKALVRPSQLSPELRLAQAISEFEADLLEDEKAEFKIQRSQSPDPLDVMRLTAQLDRSLFAKGFRRGYGPRLTRFLEGVQQFASIGDVLVGASQYLPACAVWSLVRFSLLSIVQHSDYVDRLSELFMQISRSTPRYRDMTLLFPQSKKLQDSFNEYYIIVVHICHKFMKLSRTSGFKQFLSSYSDTITRFEKQLNILADGIRDEINIQSVALAQEENKKSSRFRMLAKVDREALEKQHKERERLRVLDACSVYDYQTTWKQIRKSGNTALYRDDSCYQNWKAARHSSTLVYSGRLGAGKSVLIANIVDDLFLDSEGCYITYFFCRHDISESLYARTIIGSLARQLLLAHGDLEGLDIPLLSDHNLFSVEDLIQIMLTVRSELDKVVYVVVDGLDECSQKERDLLLDITKQCQQLPKLLLCISSRWEPDIQSKFRPTQLTRPMYSSMPEQNPEVEVYINSEIDACVNSGRLQFAQEELIPVMKNELGLKSKGMFLWVSLLISYMCNLTSDYDIVQALKELPQSLAEIYQRLLSKYAATQKQYQEAILQLVLVALRPLSTKELREALAIVPGETDWNTAKLSNNITGLLACCGGIIIVDEEELTVRFVHESARQFLIDDGGSHTSSFTVTDAEKRMAQIITTYLNFTVFDTQVSTIVTPNISGGMIVNSIITNVPQNSKLIKSVSNLIRSPNNAGPDISKVLAETAMQARARSPSDLSLKAYAKKYWFLHSAPMLNDSLVHGLVKKLVLKGLEIQTPDISNPLSWAIVNGYVLAFEYLAATGLPLEETMQSAVQVAATKGHQDIIQKYLQFPSLFLILDRDMLNFALSAQAASKGWANILRLLLNENSVQERIWHAIVASPSIMGPLPESGSRIQATYESLLEAVAKEWPCVLRSFSDRALLDDPIWNTTVRDGQSGAEAYASRHANLANSCLDLLLSADCLSKQDICQLKTPGILNSEIEKQLVNLHLPSEIQYACCHWTRHIRLSNCERRSIEDRVYKFLKSRFFFWYEAVSLIGKASEIHGMIDDLSNLASSELESKSSFQEWKPALQAILHSAGRFISETNTVADLAPLQPYYSGIIFASPDRGLMIDAVSPWLVKAPRFSDEKHSNPITSMTFSSDRQLLASASEDKTIKLWDTVSGKLLRTLVGHTYPANIVVFSPDGKLIASASEGRTIKLWDVTSGELWQTLKGHSYSVVSMVFSPDGKLLASASLDRTVNLWDVVSGRIKRRVENGGLDVDFSYLGDFLQLDTNIGSFKIDGALAFKNAQKASEARSKLVLANDWLMGDGQRLFWLPPGVFRTAKFAHFYGLMAFGTSLGHVIFLEISLDELDRSLIGNSTASQKEYRDTAHPYIF